MGYDDKRAPREGGRDFDGKRGDKPYRGGDRRDSRPYGDRPRGGKPYGDKPYGDRDRKPYGDKPRGGKPYGDRGGKSFGDKPRGDRRFDERGPRRDAKGPRKPRTGNYKELQNLIEGMDGHNFGSYRGLVGTYSFDGFDLLINHVQADPFANPSSLTVRVPQDVAEFPAELFDEAWKRTALEDALLRRFGRAVSQNACHFPDFIKGGEFFVSKPGPEILKRSAVEVSEEAVEVRFEASFPSRDRGVTARDMSTMLFEALPRIVRESLLHVSYAEGELEAIADLAEDQHALRVAIAERELVCFVADGAILPRESGISKRPMADAVAFSSPESMRCTIELPHAGSISGMGVPRGVTLIVGGGYHGKSTLVKAIESGVYDHVAGDGREFVVCDETAVKLRAEDGRSVRGVDISLFINNLPNGADTKSFWTEDASGSTSQAASTIEAAEAGSRVFILDEDTSAANFMVRDELMQAVITREEEPITPFVERLRDLYERAGISTIIVAGSSGAFFSVADTVIQMDSYMPHDITERVREVCSTRGEKPVVGAPGFAMPREPRYVSTPPHPLVWKTASIAKRENAERRETGKPDAPERIKVKAFNGVDIFVGTVGCDLRFVEQLVDVEQGKALANILRWCVEHDYLARLSVREMVDAVMKEIEENGITAVGNTRNPEAGLAMPRRQEIFACINRVRLRSRG